MSGLDNYKVSETGCWEYEGFCLPNGYSRIKYDGKVRLGHRASWMEHRGPIQDGLCVLHKCDNRKCVNPDHLFLGTKKDNTSDMIAKGRHGTKRLTLREVFHMRRLRYSGVKHKRLAALFGCSESNVEKIVRRHVWV
jgi:hypothetical protein